MKLISVEAGRITWLLPVEEIIPINGADGPNIVKAIAERYAFAQSPINPTKDDVDKNGLKFLNGQFEHGKKRTNILEFIVFNDGIVAASLSTESAEAFLEDAYSFLRSEFEFREIVSTVKRVYLSALVVEFSPSLNKALSSYQKIAKIIGEKLHDDLDGKQYPVELTRLDFALNKDPEFRPPNIPKLTIEKRAHTPVSQHRYYSSAPMQTKDHLSILEQIEKTLDAN
jgi:hypothetical protein